MTGRLFDTNILLWAVGNAPQLSREAARLVDDAGAGRWFSALSIAEVAIKSAKGRADFSTDPIILRLKLIDGGFDELPLTGIHAARLGQLPPIHKDPFDRLMIAQALAEGVPFVTADATLAGYPGQVMVV